MKILLLIIVIVNILCLIANSISAYNGTLSILGAFSFGFLCAGFLSLLISLIFN